MLKIKEWWNEFKTDLIFNLIMSGLSGVLLMFTLWMIIICFKMMIELKINYKGYTISQAENTIL